MNQTVIQNKSYLICRNGIFYYSRRVPADLHKRFNKNRVIISLRTKSKDKALRSAKTLSDRLEKYWDSLGLELFHSREFGRYTMSSVSEKTKPSSFTIDDALNLYFELKGYERRKTFFQLVNRSVDCLKEVSSTTLVESFQPADATAFRKIWCQLM